MAAAGTGAEDGTTSAGGRLAAELQIQKHSVLQSKGFKAPTSKVALG